MKGLFKHFEINFKRWLFGINREDIEKGYEKIAFGSIGDAVKLLFMEELKPKEAKKLDLFTVAEIKKPKGGGMEIKFFDRIKALQCLENISRQESSPSSFYEAILKGAEAIENNSEEEWVRGGKNNYIKTFIKKANGGFNLVVQKE